MNAATKKTAVSVIWFGIPGDNLERPQNFYGALIGWKIVPFPGITSHGAQNYLHFDAGGPDASPNGGLMKRMHPPTQSNVLQRSKNKCPERVCPFVVCLKDRNINQ